MEPGEAPIYQVVPPQNPHCPPAVQIHRRAAHGCAKASGIGREGGVHSLEFYTELRNVMIKL